MLPAAGFEYGGDFFVADVSDERLQMVLVDECGHGPTAVPDAVQFAGALAALVESLPPNDVLAAANTYVRERGNPEGFTTAVQLLLRQDTGAYRICSAGHPPVFKWSTSDRRWTIDSARGTAIGVTDEPTFGISEGVVEPGEALMFYTDGLIEARGHDIDDGIEQLLEVAHATVADGFAGAPGRILEGLPQGDDDRAVLILLREP